MLGFDFNPGEHVGGIFDTFRDLGLLGTDGMLFPIAATLITLFFVWGAINAARSGRSQEVVNTFIQALIAGTLLTATPPVQNMLEDAWFNAYNWTMSTAEQVQRGQIVSFRQRLDDNHMINETWAGVGAAVADFLVGGTGVNASNVTSAAAMQTATAGAVLTVSSATRPIGAALLRNLLGHATRFFRFLFIPIAALYLVLIFTSGIIVALGVTILPIAVALVMTRAGMGLISNTITRLISAYAALIVIPLVFAVVFGLAIAMPIENFFSGISGIVQQIQEIGEQNKLQGPEHIKRLQYDWTPLAESIVVLLDLIESIFNTLIGGVVIAFGGLVASVVIVAQLDRLVAGVMQGIAIGAVGVAAGARLGQLLPAGLMNPGSGGGGGGDGGGIGGGNSGGKDDPPRGNDVEVEHEGKPNNADGSGGSDGGGAQASDPPSTTKGVVQGPTPTKQTE